uniref:YjcQ protein n=1 Tax=uncultured bacterium Contig12 TaxID=1393397 RepID=W0FIT5_9BACT|nr:hypothetical protein [uncultured bacterium Contig12]
MAKDDYDVIVFRILGYLYKQLKSGQPAEPEMLRHDSKTCNHINEEYWKYVVTNMQEAGLIQGLKKEEGQDEYDRIEEQLKNIRITPKGIGVLSDNPMIERVEKMIKGILNIG